MFSRVLSRFNRPKGAPDLPALRKCANCGEEKPLDKEHYQIVKTFRTGFSYYCNVCDAPKRRN